MKLSNTQISEQAFRAFIRAYGLFRQHMAPYFARHGISGAQWGILRALHRAEREGVEGLRLTDLGSRLLVRPPSVTTLVDRLERLELVARVAASSDHRAKHVQLTPSGRGLVQQVLKKHPEQMRRTLAGLSSVEQQQLYHLMEKLSAHLESLEALP